MVTVYSYYYSCILFTALCFVHYNNMVYIGLVWAPYVRDRLLNFSLLIAAFC